MSLRIFVFCVVSVVSAPLLSNADLITISPPGYTTHAWLSTTGMQDKHDLLFSGSFSSVQQIFSNGAIASGGIYLPPSPDFGGAYYENARADTVSGGTYAQLEVDFYFVPLESLFYTLSINGYVGNSVYTEIYDTTSGADIIVRPGDSYVSGTLTAGDVYDFTALAAAHASGLDYQVGSEMDLAAAVPEPSTFALLGFCVIGLAIHVWRRRCVAVA